MSAAGRQCRSVIVSILAAILIASSPAAADPVQVRAAAQADMARLVFNWPAPVTYDASLNGNSLQVRFGRSIEADVAAGLSTASSYIQSARILDDGQTVQISLNPGNYQLNHFTAGNAVVVDVLGTPQPQTAAAAPAPEPEPEVPAPAPEPAPVAAETSPQVAEPVAAAAPTGGPVVGVRTGRHADKLRLVFDWDQEVPYELTRGGGVSTISFGAAAQIDTSALAGAAPQLIGEARSRGVANGTAIDLAVPDSARINLFRAGERVVADIFFPTDGAVAGRLPAVSPAAVASTEPAPAESAPAEEIAEPAEPVAEAETENTAETETAETVPDETPAVTPEAAEEAAAQSGEPTQLETAGLESL